MAGACALSAALAGWNARAAAVFQEAGGSVVIEAEHFDSRANATDDNHQYKIAPAELTADELTSADGKYLHARGGTYMVCLPDSPGGGQNRNTTDLQAAGPHLDYKVQITTTGEYQLYLRGMGYDGSSDSSYAEILELQSAAGGPGPNWYRFAMNPDNGDFSTLQNIPSDATTVTGWTGNGNPEVNNGGDNGDDAPVVWTFSKPGVYTIRYQQREDGNALDALILQRSNLPVPTDPGPAESPLASGFIIGTHPVSKTITPGGSVTFTVGALVPTGASVTYQWQQAVANSTSFSDIAGATSASYTIPAATLAMSGTQYRAAVTSAGTTLNSNPATLITDATPPAVVGAFGGPDLKNVTIRFSKKLDQATAQTASNYSGSGGLTLSNPQLQANGTDVVLGTSAQTAGTAYTVTINGVKDLVGNATSNAQAKFAGAVETTGGLRVDLFFGIVSSGTPAVSELTSDPRYPNSPDQTVFWPNFGPFAAGNNYGDNYGARITGWIVPPTTGSYKFYLRSDDASELYLSTDDKPANELLIAQQTGCCNAFTDAEGTLSSSPITLTASKKYWVRALLKEGGGDDYLQVGWRTPADSDLNQPPTDVIPGQFLRTVVDATGSVVFSQQPTNQTVAASAPASFSVAYSAFSAFGTTASVQWQKAPAGSSAFADVPGATSATYEIPFAAAADNGAQFRAVVTSAGTSVNSAAATLKVSADTTPPGILSVNGTVSSAFVSFSEPLDPASAATKANYQLNNGATVTAASVVSAAGAAGVVRLDLSGATAGSTYTLTVTGVNDLSGNAMPATTSGFVAFHIFSSFDDGAVPQGTAVNGNADVQALGSYDGSGFIELTPPVNSMQGSIAYPDVLNGASVSKFTATWKMFIGQGSGNPADGVSFNIASDLDLTSNPSEEGSGTGLIVEFDTYDNGNYCVSGVAEGPAIVVKYGGGTECPITDPNTPGNEVVRTNLAKATLVNNRWVDVAVQVTADGKITVIHDNVKYFDNVPIPGWAPIAGAHVAWGGRTGGEHEANWLDDLAVLFNADLPLAQPPTVSISAPADNATFAAGSSVTISANAQAPGGTIKKVEFFANGTSIGSASAAPYSITVPSAPQGAYVLTAAVTDGRGVTITSAPVKVVVGSPPVVLFVTADPGPLTFPGDQAIYNHLLNKGLDVQITTGTAVPNDGSTATGKVLVIISSSLGSGTVVGTTSTTAPSGDAKFLNTPVPVMDWEAALTDNFDFQADASPKGTTDAQTDINIVDASSPLAAGLSAGKHTVVSSGQTFSWSTPVGAHVVATMASDPTQACIYYYDKGEKTANGLAEPARRLFFFLQDNTAVALNTDGWALFDAAVTWLTGGGGNNQGGQPKITVSRGSTGLTISWTAGGTLESTASLVPPVQWSTESAVSPATINPTGATRFYRVRN